MHEESKVKKQIIYLLFSGLLLLNIMGSAEAALSSTAILNFDDPVYGDVWGQTVVIAGSNFSVDVNSNGRMDLGERTGLSTNNGLRLGEIQPGSVAEPGIDQPWLIDGFAEGNEGIHYTTSPVTILSDDGQGNIELDFSGWSANLAGIDIGLGGNSWGSNPDGVALMNCNNDCSIGDSFSLFYTATITEGTFSGLEYRLGFDSNAIVQSALAVGDAEPSEDLGLIATGTISAVPVPAAVWLFSSGIIGLAGFARRKKA